MSPTTIPFTDPRWRALHEGAALAGEIAPDGRSLAARTTGGTDWWRTTERDSHDGPTLGFMQRVGAGFEVSVELSVDPRVQ